MELGPQWEHSFWGLGATGLEDSYTSNTGTLGNSWGSTGRDVTRRATWKEAIRIQDVSKGWHKEGTRFTALISNWTWGMTLPHNRRHWGIHNHCQAWHHRRLPKTKPSWLYIMQIVTGKTLPALKEVLIELTLGQGTIHLGVCHEDYRWIYPEAGHPASLWCGCGFEAP
jgi:hypothetical protein